MSELGTFLFLLLISYTPNMCRTQLISGAPVIMATENVLAMTVATVNSANVDASMTQNKIKEAIASLRHNATKIRGKINSVVNETLTTFEGRIASLGMNNSAQVLNDCGIPSSSMKSTAAEILTDANTCVSNRLESIERELNDTYTSIESILEKINSDQKLAKTCVAEYGKTEMSLRYAIVTALCVTQAKERILSAIKDELSTRNDAAFLHVLYIDALKQMTSCEDRSRILSFIEDTNFIYVKIMTCISS